MRQAIDHLRLAWVLHRIELVEYSTVVLTGLAIAALIISIMASVGN